MILIATTSTSGSGSIFSTFIIPAVFLIALFCYCVIRFIKRHNADVRTGKVRKYNRLFIILCALGGLLDFLIIGLLNGWEFNPSEVAISLILLIIPGIATQGLYFIPYLIANKKHHQQENAIFILNLFAGWTIIAWIIALIWAYTEPKQNTVIQQASTISNADELMKYKELLDRGVITQEEFDIKKKQILDT